MSVIATTTNTVIDTISVGDSPFGVAVHPSGNTVYVANFDSNTVSVIAIATNTVIDTVPVGNSPFGVAVHPSGNTAYVANVNSNTVSVIATATNTVVDTVPVGNSPIAFGLFIGPLSSAVPAILNGHVTDQNTGNPIVQAFVIAMKVPTKVVTRTDNTGAYEVALLPGKWSVLCWKPGYFLKMDAVELQAGEIKTLDFLLRRRVAGSREDEIPPAYKRVIDEVQANVKAAPAIFPQHKMTTTWGKIKRQ